MLTSDEIPDLIVLLPDKGELPKKITVANKDKQNKQIKFFQLSKTFKTGNRKWFVNTSSNQTRKPRNCQITRVQELDTFFAGGGCRLQTSGSTVGRDHLKRSPLLCRRSDQHNCFHLAFKMYVLSNYSCNNRANVF